ncbi:MAG: hypothetical protein KZQ70_11060, partial [gamma proteobacterium symbiont of Lucinoma myriamae]|nr:hypothetical protein [gamma proteobacterium symbiont of Lucinoma myriamae]
CTKVIEFWSVLRKWLQRQANLILEVSDKNVIFSWQKEKSLVNHISVLAKYYIYKSKFTSKHLNLVSFRFLLKRKFENEKYIANINHKFDKFLGKWSSLYGYLNAL